MDSLSNKINGSLSFLDNQYVIAISAIILVLYSSLIAPKLPSSASKLFDNQFVKLLCIFLIAFLATKNQMLSILATLAFVLTITALNSETLGKADDIFPYMKEKKVSFENQDDGSMFEVLNKNVPQKDSIGGFDETGFAEKHLN